MECLKKTDKPLFGLYWLKRSFNRLLSKDLDKPSYGNFCAYYFYSKVPLEKALNVSPEQAMWSFSTNFIGELDCYFGPIGLIFCFLGGIILGVLDFWFYKNKQFILLYFYLALVLCLGGLSSSMFVSSFFKSGIANLLLLCFLEHYLPLSKNFCSENQKKERLLVMEKLPK